MAGDPFKLVQPGQDLAITAAAWNAVLDLVKRDRQSRLGQSAGPRGAGLPPGCVYVENASGSNLDRFAVLGIDDAMIAPADSEAGFLQRPAVKGVEPTTAHWGGRFCVLTEPTAAGAIGVGMVVGVLACTLTVNHANDRFADVDLSSPAALTTRAVGSARVLWKESGTGSGKRAVVSLGHPLPGFQVELTGPAAGGGKYAGYPWRPPAPDVSASGDLAGADLGLVDAAIAVLILNRREVGKSTHDLDTSGPPLLFDAIPLCVNEDGTLVVSIDGYQAGDCPPTE